MDKPCSYCICDCDKSCISEIQEKAYLQGKADALRDLKEERKIAHWISFNKEGVFGCCSWWNRCDQCGHEQFDDSNYCPKCGSKMIKGWT